MDALKLQTNESESLHDFKAYLEHSLRDPFTMNLKDCSLMEVIHAAIKSKSKLHPNYRESLGGLISTSKHWKSIITSSCNQFKSQMSSGAIL